MGIVRFFRPGAHVRALPLLAAGLLLMTACERFDAGADTPSPALVTALQRGVNLSHWWTGPAPNPVIRSRHALEAADLAGIREAGFTHVRLPVDPVRVFEAERPGVLRGSEIARLKRDIAAVMDAGLAIIVVMQMDSEAKKRLFASGGAVDVFASQWAQFARGLSDVPEDRLALEVLNEPETENPWAWGRLQRGLVETIREAAPDHSIIVTGAHFSDPTDLTMLAPLPDGNVIYGFHFYTPHNFTHQGASWGWDMWRRMRDLPFPSSPDAVKAAAAKADAGARSHVEHYGQQRWDTGKLRTRIQMVKQWAGRHGVTAQCTEFGVIELASPADRERWLGDSRRLIEEAGFGWTVWDYAGEVSITRTQAGAQVFDPSMLDALGL